MLALLARVSQKQKAFPRLNITSKLLNEPSPRIRSLFLSCTEVRTMATYNEHTKDREKREIATLKELMALLRAGPLPQGVTASPALLEEMEGTTKGRTTEEAIALFEAIEKMFPHTTLGDDKWYLVTLSALIGVEPEEASTLYTYLINKPQFSTSDSRKGLIRRLREALVENVSVQGVCKPLEALFSIAKLESPEDQDFTFSREHWKAGPENRARGEAWLNMIYKQNLSTATDKFAAHKDFDFISREITYGFYLSDHSILGPIETELVVLSGIMIQNLPLETAWHLRGTRRVGVSMEDVELIQQCIELVAEFGGVKLHKVPRVADIEHEV